MIDDSVLLNNAINVPTRYMTTNLENNIHLCIVPNIRKHAFCEYNIITVMNKRPYNH